MSTAGFHITEDCAEVYLQNESGMEFFQLARRLHDYLQQGQRLPARSLFEATDDCKEISREAFHALAKHRMENTGEVSGLFELDFDARTFSALNIMDGWKVYAMQDMADAAAQAYQEAEMSEDDCWRIFLDRLDGRELTTPSRLPIIGHRIVRIMLQSPLFIIIAFLLMSSNASNKTEMPSIDVRKKFNRHWVLNSRVQLTANRTVRFNKFIDNSYST